MARVITFSRTFPEYHIRKGEHTFFVEKFLKSWDMVHSFIEIAASPLIDSCFINNEVFENCLPKNTTIRKGHRFKEGDLFSPRIWGNDINTKSKRSGPYHSKQIILAPDTLIKKVYNFTIDKYGSIEVNGKQKAFYGDIAKNDGLSPGDFRSWFKMPENDKLMKPFDGQIICWNENVHY